jgi:hypothetical protein
MLQVVGSLDGPTPSVYRPVISIQEPRKEIIDNMESAMRSTLNSIPEAYVKVSFTLKNSDFSQFAKQAESLILATCYANRFMKLPSKEAHS